MRPNNFFNVRNLLGPIGGTLTGKRGSEQAFVTSREIAGEFWRFQMPSGEKKTFSSRVLSGIVINDKPAIL
jgi:hypothetical protein